MKIENPRFFRTDEKALGKAQRRLAKAEKGTPERKKARKIVAHVHERIANRRLNFAHQTSRKVVNRFGTIVFEDLNITTMQKNPHLAKSIADVAWNQFITITGSKAEEAGSRVILVNPRNTSQMCSRCGMFVAKTLSDRVHSCPHCGLAMDRDQNAGDQEYEIGTAISGVTSRDAPDERRGSSHRFTISTAPFSIALFLGRHDEVWGGWGAPLTSGDRRIFGETPTIAVEHPLIAPGR